MVLGCAMHLVGTGIACLTAAEDMLCRPCRIANLIETKAYFKLHYTCVSKKLQNVVLKNNYNFKICSNTVMSVMYSHKQI